MLVLAILAGAADAAAQSAGSDHLPSTGGRTLGGHTFVPLAPVPSPFVGTTFEAAFGGAIAIGIVEPIVVNVAGRQDTLLPSGDLAFGVFQLTYQQKVAHRFAVRGVANVTVRTGTNARMLFAEGLSAVDGFTLGGLASLYRDEHHMLTATLDLRAPT